MKFRKIKLFVSKGWALLVCSFSVAVLALMSSCRSKKVDKAPDVPDEDSSEEVMDGFIVSRMGEGLTPMVALPGDSKAVRDMIEESNSLKETLGRRMNSLIYGPPEMMERRAAENEQMRHKIDSIDAKVKKERYGL